MLRMTKQTDYGIVLMTHLAQVSSGASGQFSAPELAQALRIPPPMVAKILKLLARDGLLVSHRGVRGGYALARPPAEISVAQVIGALEGSLAMTECGETDHSDCLREPFCAVRGNWQVINRVVRQALESITLAEMARPDATNELVRLGGHRADRPAPQPLA